MIEVDSSKKSMFFRPYMSESTMTVSTAVPSPSMGLTSSSLVLGILNRPATRMNRQIGMFT